MKTYKFSLGWAIFGYIFFPPILGLVAWLLITKLNLNLYWSLAIVISVIVVLVFAFLESMLSKLVIYEDKLVFIDSIFPKRELMFDEISGFSQDRHCIYILSNTKSKKHIKVSQYFGRKRELLDWLSGNFTDFDSEEAKAQKEIDEQVTQEILKSQEFGSSVPERKAKLKDAHNTAKILIWTGGIIGLWTCFYPKPYEFAIYASLAFPIISSIIVKKYKGTILIFGVNSLAYPFAGTANVMPALGLFYRALLNYNILDYTNVWLPTSVISIILVALFFNVNKEVDYKKRDNLWAVLFISVLVFGYTYGAMIHLNYMLDKSKPEIYSTKIISKTIDNRPTTYNLELEPWSKQEEIEEVSVKSSLYHNVEVNEEVKIVYKKGKFGIPWYEVYKKTE